MKEFNQIRQIKLSQFSLYNLKLLCALAMVPLSILFIVFLYGNSVFDSSQEGETDANINGEIPTEEVDISEQKSDFATQISRKLALPTPTETESPKTTKSDKRLVDSNGDLLTIELQPGETLSTLAQKKFGNKAFWVYIFDVNRDQLSSPKDVSAGMKLYVPNPEYFGFSANDKSSVQYAKHRADEILGNNE